MLEPLITRYGLLAIFAGAGIEGEAVVVTGGVLAERGLLPLAGVMIAATFGSFVLDQAWFHAGRRFRDRPFIARFAAKPAFARAVRFVDLHPRALILSFRFIPGMRTVSPIALGMSHVPTRVFIPLNLLAATLWAPLLTMLGYWLGHRALPLIERIGGVGLRIVGAVAIVVATVALGMLLWRGWRKKQTKG